MLLNVFFITGNYHGEMTNMSPTSNPPIIEEFKKEFVVQEPPRTAHKGKQIVIVKLFVTFFRFSSLIFILEKKLP